MFDNPVSSSTVERNPSKGAEDKPMFLQDKTKPSFLQDKPKAAAHDHPRRM